MKKTFLLLGTILLLLSSNSSILGQTTGSIAGSITDANGAVVAGAKVTVVGMDGVEHTTVTSENGTFRIPALGAGLYKVIGSASNFKKFVVENVKVDVGVPATVNMAME